LECLSLLKTINISKLLHHITHQPWSMPTLPSIRPGPHLCPDRNISLTTWSTLYLCDKTWAKENKLRTDLINCHEMAHSYFGDSVVIRHFDHAWLKAQIWLWRVTNILI